MILEQAQALFNEILAKSDINLQGKLSIFNRKGDQSSYMILVEGFIAFVHKLKILDLAQKHGLKVDEERQGLVISTPE